MAVRVDSKFYYRCDGGMNHGMLVGRNSFELKMDLIVGKMEYLDEGDRLLVQIYLDGRRSLCDLAKCYGVVASSMSRRVSRLLCKVLRVQQFIEVSKRMGYSETFVEVMARAVVRRGGQREMAEEIGLSVNRFRCEIRKVFEYCQKEEN